MANLRRNTLLGRVGVQELNAMAPTLGRDLPQVVGAGRVSEQFSKFRIVGHLNVNRREVLQDGLRALVHEIRIFRGSA